MSGNIGDRNARTLTRGVLAVCLPLALLLAGPAAASPPVSDDPVPPVLGGDTWLQHHRDDLMPYWLLPEALGDPVGNFPSWRGQDGELLPALPNRGASTLGRGVYGYSLAFLLTGDPAYLTVARAGLDWIETRLEDPVHGGYFAELDATGTPVNSLANKDLFDLASVGLGYAMYYNVTRDPEAEAKLLAIRDLVFGPYYDAAANRLKDSLTYDLSAEFDTGGNGGDITDYLVPGTAFLLPSIGLLSDPARNAQFRADLRNVTQALINRHKNSAAANPANRWMFWGRTARFGNFNAPQTDFGHTIKSYAMIHNANQLFDDRPWSALAADRAIMVDRAWDDVAGRWNARPMSFAPGNVEPDSAWWVHDEGDQLLSALDLAGTGFPYAGRLERSTSFFLTSYVDRESPARETFTRISRNPADTELRKSAFGKNMLHNMEHALVLYLHGRAMEGRPARLHYAFPMATALVAEARPYWFDATGQERIDLGALAGLPGRHLVAVDFTGIGQVPPAPYPPPADVTPPTIQVETTPSANSAGWNRDDVTVVLSAQDDMVGVRSLRAQVHALDGQTADTAFVRPGDHTSVRLIEEGRYRISYAAADLLGNTTPAQDVEIAIDRTAPSLSGLPAPGCELWPPNHRFVLVADVDATDGLSGVADIEVGASSTNADPDDVRVTGSRVWVRAELGPRGRDRTYTVTATATDLAGNQTTASGTCTVAPPGRS
ncbi:AGE family epimerase/isomerase [Nocardioides sp. SR21]|uniref:AGE family epimerase/isomerase n=1 Tax=Nocardioides sp. SR21 TaxID=2919501 RepID=UPI001FAA8168|nr:AGE family epimerase/isomerase [Nocardioides sp. SR21]